VSSVVEVTAQNGGGRSMTLLQVGRHDKKNAFWALSESPEDKSASAAAVMKSVLGLSASTYPKAGAVPNDADFSVVLQIQVRSQAKAIGEITFARGPAFEGAEKKVHYAKTEKTRTWVPLSAGKAKELLGAADELFGTGTNPP
jgi:hypothetical protein